MAKFVSVFISPTHRRMLSIFVWLLAFATVLTISGAYVLYRTAEGMKLESRVASDQFLVLQRNLVAAFAAMDKELTATPCSDAFSRQLRRIAYIPDGLSEFMYAPDGQVQCSISNGKFEQAVDLGTPDIAREGTGGFGALWVDKELDFLGLDGERGSLLLVGPYAVVIPPQPYSFTTSHWMSIEAVLVGQGGDWWYRGGETGVYERVAASADQGLFDGFISDLSCDAAGLHCIAAEADLKELATSRPGVIAALLIVAAGIAAFAANRFNAFLTRYWSFEARFIRYLHADSIVCMYQPVMELETAEITGCEVLARWRDVDDSIVFPDRFIHLIEEHDMTLRFTEMVAKRAFAELSQRVPDGKKLQLNFNIFPRDLNADDLSQIYSGFLAQHDRFDIVLEIIESDEIPPNAQREIERLRRLGIRTYIDDFGTGYSNMQNLAALSVDGVKLDRAFAMAPDNSMMARMLSHAVDMIHATGRVMVVEGVETVERLTMLRDMQARIDYVQGYFISRPLEIDAFVEFLTPEPVSLAERRKKVGLDIVAA